MSLPIGITARETFDRVMIESGQFCLAPDKNELDLDKFIILIRATLGTYNKYHPRAEKFNIDTAGESTFTFTDTSAAGLGIPAWISDVIPIRTYNSLNSSIFNNLSGGSNLINSSSNPWLQCKQEAPWTYRCPILYVPFNGEYDITAVYNHVVEETETGNGIEYNLPTLSHESGVFFQLLTGKFLVSLAGSRRAFTHTNLEITTDADTLKIEGNEMILAAIENLHNNHNLFFLAWR